MFLRQSIEGIYINPFTLPEVGAEVKKNNVIFGKPGRGRKFYLMQELNRYAEDWVVSSKYGTVSGYVSERKGIFS
ncbi:hypothetical protein [Bacillus cereus]|uniref:hypothetical protein n=1 Tax=Bacillus cereus TaxID=1396 RepID=UPI001E4EA947|nr:hypothetical protein [Bacillus cereus]